MTISSKVLARTRGAFAYGFRPLTELRGAGRICRIFNQAFLRLGAPSIQIAQMRDGSRMWVDLRSQTEWFSYYSGRYDQPVLEFILKTLSKSEGNFLDVGGNIGMYSVRIATFIEHGRRCICFEPVPSNVSRIRDNVVLNGVQNEIEIHEIALSDKDGFVDLVLREDFESGSSTGNASVAISKEADGEFKKIIVPTGTLDELCFDHKVDNIDIVKLDIEGHEDAFFKGAYSWLIRERPVIFVEINNWFYERKGTSTSAAFSESLPEKYSVALVKSSKKGIQLQVIGIEDLSELRNIETCVMYPDEMRSWIFES